MRKIESLIRLKLDSKPKQWVAAIIVLAIAYGVPAYALRNASWDKFEPNVYTIGLPILYSVAIFGFIYLIFGKTGGLITTPDTDKKIANIYRKIITPIYWMVLTGLIVFTVYWGIQAWMAFSA